MGSNFHNKLLIGSLLALSGCATPPPLSEGASQVRIINPSQARSCTFIRQIQYRDRILGAGKDPTVMDEIGVDSLRNLVVMAGGNSLIITNPDSSWFTGSINYEGEAYRCP